MSDTRHDEAELLFDKLAETFEPDNAITLTLLLQRRVADALDERRGATWRTRSDGVLVHVPSDEHVEALFEKSIELLGRASAVTLMLLLDWRAARALDRRLGPGWRDRGTA